MLVNKKMKIKTTEEIKKWNPIRPQASSVEMQFRNRKWVDVDDLILELKKLGKVIDHNEPIQIELDKLFENLNSKEARER